MTQGHPFYTQHLCHVLWELCESKLIDNGSFLITDRFFRLWIQAVQAL